MWAAEDKGFDIVLLYCVFKSLKIPEVTAILVTERYNNKPAPVILYNLTEWIVDRLFYKNRIRRLCNCSYCGRPC